MLPTTRYTKSGDVRLAGADGTLRGRGLSSPSRSPRFVSEGCGRVISSGHDKPNDLLPPCPPLKVQLEGAEMPDLRG